MAVEVAHQVMHEIAPRYLPPARREPLLRTKASPTALALYKRARLAHMRSQAYDWMRTRELYEAAIHEEPRFAEAWSGLSDVWLAQTLGGAPGECDLAGPRAKECARRAIALQPLNAEAHATLGQLAGQHDFDLAAAEDSMRRAVSVDPGYVQGRSGLAMVLAMRGQTEEALRELAAAQQLDPITLDLTPAEAMLYFHARRFEDARARFREMLAINPDTLIGNWGLMHTYIIQKNWGEAIAAARNLPQFPPVPEGIAPTEEGFLKTYRGYESFMREGRRQDRFNDYFLAMYYGQLGNQDAAFNWLNDAVDNHVPNLSYIMVDPRLDTLRNDARFNTIVARMNLGRPPKLATLDPLLSGARTGKASRR
jgi:tetratricopeptide (TPR) repeat protein